MSIKLMSKIWDHPELARGQTIVTKDNKEVDQQNKLRTMKFVLLCLADMANDDGVCWPSNKTIAERANLTPDYVRSIMGTLKANGWLTTADRFSETGKRTSNWVTLDKVKISTPHLVHPSDLVGGTPPHLVHPTPPDLVGGTIEPSIETKEETPVEREEDDEKPVTSGDVHKLWQQNMPGTLTAIIVDDINDLIETYGAEEVALAITSAVRNNGRSIRYVQKVLESRAAGKDRQPPREEKRKPGPVTVYNQYTGKKEQVMV